MSIRRFERQDFERVQEIYKQGIDTQNATFQIHKKSWQQWQDSMLQDTCIVLCRDDNAVDLENHILGWAGLSAISSREVYAGVAEVSIYVDRHSVNQGIGKQLLNALIELSELQGFWTLQAAIFVENEASLKLHLKHGFEIVGRRHKLGKMQDKWRDVLLIERRSCVVGVD
jgi:phosphinothricin acetyltransferase